MTVMQSYSLSLTSLAERRAGALHPGDTGTSRRVTAAD
jgi:hypothetical protein